MRNSTRKKKNKTRRSTKFEKKQNKNVKTEIQNKSRD